VTFVGRVSRARLEGGAFVRLEYPPFDVLVSLIGGVPVAIEDACNHAGASLAEGERHGNCVSCPMHGYLFDLASGRLDGRIAVHQRDGGFLLGECHRDGTADALSGAGDDGRFAGEFFVAHFLITPAATPDRSGRRKVSPAA